MKHLAIIMDGNGRYAQRFGKTRAEGHVVGAEAFTRLVQDFATLPISFLTVYAFSTENGNRDLSEVEALFKTIADTLCDSVYPIAAREGISIRFIGRTGDLPEYVRNVLKDAPVFPEGKTLIIALYYGGDDEICRAINALLYEKEPITIESLRRRLDTSGLPDPDAVLRYGGEKRLSNFLPLQTTYSELFFTDKYWPEYSREDVESVIEAFSRRKRNFGV